MRRGSRKLPFPNELLVLSVIDDLGDATTANILDRVVTGDDGKAMNAATVYRVVNRLTKQGRLTQDWVLPNEDEKQRAHRKFTLTAEGRNALAAGRDEKVAAELGYI